jgi:hypothetical protein
VGNPRVVDPTEYPGRSGNILHSDAFTGHTGPFLSALRISSTEFLVLQTVLRDNAYLLESSRLVFFNIAFEIHFFFQLALHITWALFDIPFVLGDGLFLHDPPSTNPPVVSRTDSCHMSSPSIHTFLLPGMWVSRSIASLRYRLLWIPPQHANSVWRLHWRTFSTAMLLRL